MKTYRIVEFEGTVVKGGYGETYIPRYEVQELQTAFSYWEKINEFNDLDKAKAFKRNLELKQGVVIE